MDDLKDKVIALAKGIFPEVIKHRRHLHQYPELSYQETQTGLFIAQQLKRLGIPFQHGIAENGVVGIIEGQQPGDRVVALRADFDALPITEANDVPYKSKHEGVMHACGHDVHTASLLGAAEILNSIRESFGGTVKLIFQPAEERLPGGASIMIKEGVLENPRPDVILGQHVHPPLHSGKIGMRPGRYMASADEIYVTVRGRGGHGALPQDCIDPILITAHLITALQQVVSRRSDPTVPSVLTFGKINSTEGATNIIPNEVKLLGTFRTMDETWRAEAHEIMTKMATSVAEGMGGSCDFEILKGYPYLTNHESFTRKAFKWTQDFLGEAQVEELPIRMTAEDFSYFSQAMPACFYRLGTGNPEKGITSPVHTNTFDIDEDSLETSIGVMAWLTLQALAETD